MIDAEQTNIRQPTVSLWRAGLNIFVSDGLVFRFSVSILRHAISATGQRVISRDAQLELGYCDRSSAISLCDSAVRSVLCNSRAD